MYDMLSIHSSHSEDFSNPFEKVDIKASDAMHRDKEKIKKKFYKKYLRDLIKQFKGECHRAMDELRKKSLQKGDLSELKQVPLLLEKIEKKYQEEIKNLSQFFAS